MNLKYFQASLAIFLIGLLSKSIVICKFSGFYVDNGIGQTVVEERIAQTETHLMREHILDLLDLPDQPDTERFPSVRRQSVPKYLMELYKRLSEKEYADKPGDINQAQDDMLPHPRRRRQIDDNVDIADEIIEKSDLIMTFLNNRNAFAVQDNETRLSFDLSEVSSNGIELLMSDLHLYKRRMPERHIDSNLVVITIYDTTYVNNAAHDVQIRPIVTINTTVGFEGWIRINFTSMLSDWIVNKRPNNLLSISIEYQNENGELDTPSIDANYLLSYWDSQHQPFITAYFKNEDSDCLIKQHRSKRSARPLKPRKSHGRLSTLLHNPFLSPRKAFSDRSCQIYTLYISFQELRWDDWILAPTGYEARYCAGSCDFPFSHNVIATNHAVIQTLAHLMQSHHIPKSCCAPSKLQSIQLLYVQNETITKLKKFRGMVAEECSCQ